MAMIVSGKLAAGADDGSQATRLRLIGGDEELRDEPPPYVVVDEAAKQQGDDEYGL